MKRNVLILTVAVFACVLSAAYLCIRHFHIARANAAQEVGTYKLIGLGGVDEGTAFVLSADWRFTGIRVPSDWLTLKGAPIKSAVNIGGTWSVGEDDEGSRIVTFVIGSVDGRAVNEKVVGRPFLSPSKGLMIKTVCCGDMNLKKVDAEH